MKKKNKAPILSILNTLSENGIETIEDSESDNLPTSDAFFKNREENLDIISEHRGGGDGTLVTIHPELCVAWEYADRSPEEMGDIESLAESILKNGQQEPALVREIKSNVHKSKAQYEIIFGNRRWQACRMANVPLKAILKRLTDQEAAVAQKEENSNRENLSDLSRAKSFKKMIEKGLFSSASQLAISMNISKQTMSEIMSFNKIPSAILEALPSPHSLSRRSAAKLATIDCNDKNTIMNVINLAGRINSGEIPSDRVLSEVKKNKLNETQKLDIKNNKSNVSAIKKKSGDILLTISSTAIKDLEKGELMKEIEKEVFS